MNRTRQAIAMATKECVISRRRELEPWVTETTSAFIQIDMVLDSSSRSSWALLVLVRTWKDLELQKILTRLFVINIIDKRKFRS